MSRKFETQDCQWYEVKWINAKKGSSETRFKASHCYLKYENFERITSAENEIENEIFDIRLNDDYNTLCHYFKKMHFDIASLLSFPGSDAICVPLFICYHCGIPE